MKEIEYGSFSPLVFQQACTARDCAHLLSEVRSLVQIYSNLSPHPRVLRCCTRPVSCRGILVTVSFQPLSPLSHLEHPMELSEKSVLVCMSGRHRVISFRSAPACSSDKLALTAAVRTAFNDLPMAGTYIFANE